MSPDNQPFTPQQPQDIPPLPNQQQGTGQPFNTGAQPGYAPNPGGGINAPQPQPNGSAMSGFAGPATGQQPINQSVSGLPMQPNAFQGAAVPVPPQPAQPGGSMFQLPTSPQPQQAPGFQPGAMPVSQPAPQQLQQLPPQPGFMQPQPQQGMYNQGQPFRPQKRRRKLLVPIAALVALVVLAGGGVAYMRLAGGPITYAASDATTYSTNSYEIAVPKQWSDQSSNSAFLNKVLGGDSMSDVKDLKTYAYNYDDKALDASAIMMAGYMETGASDDELRQALASQADRESFETEMAKSVDNLGTGGDGCESVTSKDTKTEYDVNGYIVRFVVSADCKIAADSTSTAGLQGDSARMQMLLGAKNGKFYVSMLLTLSDDWQRNQAFYNDHIISSLKPKS